MNVRRMGLLLFSFLLMLAATFGFGQGIVTGSISGTVLDPQKAVVPGATVTAVQAGTNSTFTTQTSGEGYFFIPNLPIGTYTLTVDAAKFNKLQISNINVNSGQNNNLGSQALSIGASETVSVEAAAPLIETTSSQIGASFDTKAISKLPNAGGLDNLALYVPGIANNGATNFSNTNGAAIANNGLRGRSNNFQIDGQANNDNSVAGPLVFLSNPDLVGEVQVVSNNFSAEYGRNSGSVVNYITKSGTNNYHGTAYELNTGNWTYSHLNSEKNPVQGFCPPGVAPKSATQFSSSCTAPVIPRFVDNRFGATFGGPALKNRLWFFGSYQEDKQRAKTVGTSSSITPTPDGLTQLAAAFPNNPAVTALQTFGPYGLKAGNPTPAGNIQQTLVSNGTTSVTVPFAFVTRTLGNNFDDRQITARGDWQISNKDRFFFRYIYQNSVTAVGSGTVSSGALVAVPAQDRQYGFDYTRTWTSNFVQQTRVGYGKGFFQFAGGQTFPQCSIEKVTDCPPNISFSDASGTSFTTFGLATNLPQDRQVHNTQVQNNSTWTHGHHTFKFGGELDHQNSPNHFLPSINGGFQFNSNPAVGTSPAMSAFSNFIRGAANCPAASGTVFNGICSQTSLTNGPFNFNFAENDLAFYGQDDWRIKDNLTLNLGLRWEWDQQAINLLHDISVKNVAAGFWLASAPTSVTEIPKIPEDFNNFGPNIGFAWTPRIWQKMFGEDKTVIRGGYRIAYDPAFYNIFLNVATGAPVVNSGTIFNVGLPGTLTGAGVQSAYLSSIPSGQNPGSRNQTRVSSDFHNPYVEQWSLGVERQVTSRISFESRYVGNHSIGNFQTFNGNPLICSSFSGTTFTGANCTAGLMVSAPSLIPSGVAPCSTAAATAAAGPNASTADTNARVGRVDCNFTNLRVRNNGAWSIYHGLQNELKVRAFHGFTANVAYTWSKALDNTSEVFSSTGGVSTPASQNPFDPNFGERGVAAQSFPHVVGIYWVHELPWMQSQQGILGRLLGGWQWSGTYRYQTGVAITPIQNTNNGDPYCDAPWNNAFIGTGNDSCRPLLSNPSAPFNTVGRYLSATQVVNVTTCQNTNAVTLGTALCPFIDPRSVHFIVNNAFAVNALCGGNPFACDVSRNVSRAMPRNQLDLSIAKSFRLTERFSLQLRGDAFNLLNYQYLGVPGLNVNNRNINGLSATVANGVVTSSNNAAPNTFGETWNNTGTRRSFVVGARVQF